MLVIYIATLKSLVLMEQQYLALEDHFFVFATRKQFVAEQTMFLIKRAEKNETRFSYDTIMPEVLRTQDNYLNVYKL
jgi:hypothetical protein